jgi:hypothetical protein
MQNFVREINSLQTLLDLIETPSQNAGLAIASVECLVALLAENVAANEVCIPLHMSACSQASFSSTFTDARTA